MSPSLTLSLLCGVLFGTGTVLLLSRSLVRALLGVLLMGNGANLLYLVASGRPGAAPIVDGTSNPPIGAGGIADPLPQAMVLTAIVITLAVTAFTLALAHRAWELRSSDLIDDDEEGRRAHDRAVSNDLSESDFRDTRDPYSVDVPESVPDAVPDTVPDAVPDAKAEATTAGVAPEAVPEPARPTDGRVAP